MDSTGSLTSRTVRNVANSASDTADNVVTNCSRVGGVDQQIQSNHQLKTSSVANPTHASTGRRAQQPRGGAAWAARIVRVGAPPAAVAEHTAIPPDTATAAISHRRDLRSAHIPAAHAPW